MTRAVSTDLDALAAELREYKAENERLRARVARLDKVRQLAEVVLNILEVEFLIVHMGFGSELQEFRAALAPKEEPDD